MKEKRDRSTADRLWEIAERLVRFFLSLFERVVKRPLKEETKESVVQFVKFGIIGISNTLVSYVVYLLSLSVFSLAGSEFAYDYVVSNCVAFLLSVLWSWFFNSRRVFPEKEGEHRVWWRTLIRTYEAYAFTGLFLANAESFFWVSILHLPRQIAPLLNIVINVPINFVLNKLWAYRDVGRKERENKKEEKGTGEELGKNE